MAAQATGKALEIGANLVRVRQARGSHPGRVLRLFGRKPDIALCVLIVCWKPLDDARRDIRSTAA